MTTFLLLLVYWILTGTILNILYIFAFHKGIDSFCEFRIYYDTTNQWKRIIDAYGKNMVIMTVFLIAFFIPFYPIMAILSDLALQKLKNDIDTTK